MMTAFQGSDFKRVELTKELYQILIEEDYQYFFICDIVEEGNFKNYIFMATKEMPSVPGYSCISIKDEMVRNIIAGKVKDTTAVIRVPIRNTSDITQQQ